MFEFVVHKNDVDEIILLLSLSKYNTDYLKTIKASSKKSKGIEIEWTDTAFVNSPLNNDNLFKSTIPTEIYSGPSAPAF